MSVNKMGNGSMKSKHLKQADSTNISTNGVGRIHKDGTGPNGKNTELGALRTKVEDLEREGKRSDELLSTKVTCHIDDCFIDPCPC